MSFPTMSASALLRNDIPEYLEQQTIAHRAYSDYTHCGKGVLGERFVSIQF